MIPILYSKTETAFTTNGLGRLSDALSCVVTEERNGSYELAMEYYENGIHADELETDMIIYAKPSATNSGQPFRIYKITKPLNQRFKVYARHISYDLSYVSVFPFSGATTATEAMQGLFSNADGIGNFTLGTVSVSRSGTFAVDVPASFRNWIGGRNGSILDTFHGELEWDGYTVNLWASRGRDRGLTLRYGKNISDISKTEEIDYTITGVSPYFKTADKQVLTLPEKSVYKDGVSYTTPTRVMALDMQSYVDESGIREANPEATEEQINAMLITAMRTAAQAYADTQLSGVPDATIEVAFVDLSSTEEYKGIASLFTVASLCDTVTVEYSRLGISVQSKIVKTEYDVLQERYDKLTVGKVKQGLADKLVSISTSVNVAAGNASAQTEAAKTAADNDAEDAASDAYNDAKSYADAKKTEAINAAASNTATAIATNTDLITGNSGGYVVLNRDANGYPYEILIMDTADITTATKVWRWNASGLGYSSTGYNGTYTTALSSAGIFNTDFIAANSLSGSTVIAGTLDAGKITTGYLDAGIIKAGLLQDLAGLNFINMISGEFQLAGGNLIYDVNDGDFVQLQNNLSLKLNGIPLAGIVHNFRVSNPSARTVLSDAIMLYSFGNGCTVTAIHGQVVQMPNMVMVNMYIDTSGSSSGNVAWVITGLPAISSGDDSIHPAAVQSGTSYTVDTVTCSNIAWDYYGNDLYQQTESGYIAQLYAASKSGSRTIYFSFCYASNAELVELAE